MSDTKISGAQVALIGAGNMGYAILKGMLDAGLYPPQSVFVADKSAVCLERAKKLGVKVSDDAAAAVAGAKTVIFAVKPNAFAQTAEQVKDSIPADAVIVSILAGKKISVIDEALGGGRKVVRVMPNTPALVGCGMSGVCAAESVSSDDVSSVIKIFSCFGRAVQTDESMMDTVTGISGSGPAYAFMFIDAMAKSAVRHGMSEEQAKLFSAQTVLGAAKMVLESDESPEQLKINVCSPGGTTIEAVKVFEQSGLYQIVDSAIDACIEKSKKMSE